MQTIFANSSIGIDAVTLITDVTRNGLNCATAAELASCRFVRTDGMAFVVHSGLKFGIAHVRVDAQVTDLYKLKKHVGVDVDVYMVGGFASQFGPANAILNHYSKMFGYGLASGVHEIYAHVRKPNSFLTGQTDDTGHVPGFVASVGPNNYLIGTHSLLGCVGVLIVPQNTAVTMKKIHLYDATNTLGAIGAFGGDKLTTQVF